LAGLPRLAELTISGGSLGFRRLPKISKAFEVLSFDLLELIVCSFLSLILFESKVAEAMRVQFGFGRCVFRLQTKAATKQGTFRMSENSSVTLSIEALSSLLAGSSFFLFSRTDRLLHRLRLSADCSVWQSTSSLIRLDESRDIIFIPTQPELGLRKRKTKTTEEFTADATVFFVEVSGKRHRVCLLLDPFGECVTLWNFCMVDFFPTLSLTGACVTLWKFCMVVFFRGSEL